MASNGRHTEQLRKTLKRQADFAKKVGRFRAGNLAMSSAVRDAQQTNSGEPPASARRKALAARRIKGN